MTCPFIYFVLLVLASSMLQFDFLFDLDHLPTAQTESVPLLQELSTKRRRCLQRQFAVAVVEIRRPGRVKGVGYALDPEVAWRGLSDKAKLYYYLCEYHRADFPGLGSYSKFVEATNRYTIDLRGLLALVLAHNRQAHQPYPVVFQDSTALPVCKVARASQHRTFKPWARKSKTGGGWWYGFKLHVQCDEEGRLCAFDLTTASVDDRKLLEPLTRWMQTGIVVGDRGYISEAKAYELGRRGVYVLTGIRKNMRKLASPFQLACLQARHRIEEPFEFLKCAFGLVRSTHRASYALPIHSEPLAGRGQAGGCC